MFPENSLEEGAATEYTSGDASISYSVVADMVLIHDARGSDNPQDMASLMTRLNHELGRRILIAHVDIDNHRMRKFLRRMGFRELQVIMGR